MTASATATAEGGIRASRGRSLVRWAIDQLPPVVVFVGGLLVWEFLPRAIGLQTFILPPPTAIARALGQEWPLLSRSAVATLYEAVVGLGIGVLLGSTVAFLVSRYRSLRDALLPVAVAISAVPIIAIAPITNNWFGTNSPNSKIAVVALLVFFPVMINVTRGLTQVHPGSLELMRSYAASEATILRKVRLPNALPFFFTALKVSSTLSLIGAIVGEYFGGSTEVLGRVIVRYASSLRFDVTWAAIWLAAATGIVFYLVIVLVERVVIPWHASQRATER